MRYPVPAKLVKASKLLLLLLIENCGGTQATANQVKVSKQGIIHFKNRGYIPLAKIYSIAKDMQESVWALSYFKLYEIFGTDSPDFSNIVVATKLSSEAKAKVLKIINK